MACSYTSLTPRREDLTIARAVFPRHRDRLRRESANYETIVPRSHKIPQPVNWVPRLDNDSANDGGMAALTIGWWS